MWCTLMVLLSGAHCMLTANGAASVQQVQQACGTKGAHCCVALGRTANGAASEEHNKWGKMKKLSNSSDGAVDQSEVGLQKKKQMAESPRVSGPVKLADGAQQSGCR